MTQYHRAVDRVILMVAHLRLTRLICRSGRWKFALFLAQAIINYLLNFFNLESNIFYTEVTVAPRIHVLFVTLTYDTLRSVVLFEEHDRLVLGRVEALDGSWPSL